MDKGCENELASNLKRFQRSLERISERYSKLQYEDDDDAIEVDLNSTQIDTLERYMTRSKKNLNKIQSKSFAFLSEQSLSLDGITRNSQLDIAHKERSGKFETTFLSEDNVTHNDTTASSLDENQRNYTLINNQPEDQDEQLEMTLQSQGSCLGDLYPNMISQLGKAWHRQHVTEAADSVLRRYRKWRLSNRSYLINSFHPGLRHTNNNKTSGEVVKKHHMTSPVKSLAVPSIMTKAVSQSPVKNVVVVLDQKSQLHCSPVRRREAPPTAVVMDLMPFACEPNKIVLNKTFTVSEETSKYSYSPSRSYYFPKTSQDLSLRIMEPCVSPRRIQGTSCTDNAVLKERPDIYASPVRQSLYQARLASRESFSKMTDSYGSPVRKSPFKLQTCTKSPRESPCAIKTSAKCMQSVPRVRQRHHSFSHFISSPPQSPTIRVPKRTLQYPEPPPSPQQPQWSPQLAKTGRTGRGLRRHHSVDSSSMLKSHSSYSTKDFEAEFIELYHKLVCLNKSFLNRHPCRFCAKSSEASRRHSFSNLAALALSPHRPLLRKRHRELDSYPESKRFRDGHYTYRSLWS